MKQLKKIALVSTTAFTINSFMLSHIKKLNKNYKILIFCNNAFSLKKKVPNDVSLINLNFYRKPKLLSDLKSFLLLSYFLIKNKPILTISISPKAGLLTAISSSLLRVPYRIHWFTGQVWITKKGIAKVFYKIVDKIIFNLSNHSLIDSHSQRKFLILNKIITKDKSSVLLNGSVGGVNIKKFKFNSSFRYKKRKKLNISNISFVFLYLGRINKDKGVIDLIEAFKKIKGIHGPFLFLVGPIESNDIKNLTKFEKKIMLFGETPNPEKWFSFADILCLPSYREGFGSVVIEAGSCSLPSLGSNIYGIKDAIIKNETGLLHKVGSVEEIKKKLLFAMNNKKLLRKFGKNAKKRVQKNFEENLMSKKFLEFVNSKIG